MGAASDQNGRSRRVGVFCGSRSGSAPVFLKMARTLGRALAARGWGLVYGGARVGTMGALADAALEAGGVVYGVIPRALGGNEVAHRGLHELFLVDGMHARKAMMANLSDAFCVLPGGWGTLDEAFEALTWNQLGYHHKPLALYGPPGFWDHILAHADAAVAHGLLEPEHRRLMYASTAVDAVLEHLSAAELQVSPGGRPAQ